MRVIECVGGGVGGAVEDGGVRERLSRSGGRVMVALCRSHIPSSA